MSDADKQLVWSMREKLVSDRRALTKFLHAVDWQDAKQVSQTEELLSQWETIDVVTGVRLLAGDAAEHKSEIVRAHAIGALSTASDETLQLYLLQLVQALRYDSDSSIYKSGEDPKSFAAGDLLDAVERLGVALEAQGDLSTTGSKPVGAPRSLAELLIRRASHSLPFATQFHWLLSAQIACEASSMQRARFCDVSRTFCPRFWKFEVERVWALFVSLERR